MPPLTIMIKPVSSGCNMRCRYCFYTDVAEHRQQYSMGRMSEETLETLVRRAMRYAEGSVSFAFQGGEPTLAGAEFYRQFVSYTKKYNSKGLRVDKAIQSNGFDISDELMDIFAEENFLVGISMDGTELLHDKMRIDTAGQGSYQRVKATAERLRAKGVEFNILCVVNEYVARQAEEVFDALAPYGFIQFIPCLDELDGRKRDWSLSQCSYTDFLKKTFDRYYAAYKKGRPVSVRNFDNYIGIILGLKPENCGMSGRCAQYYLVEADGSVYPCDFYVLDQWRMGNVREDSFFTLAKSPVAERFRQDSLHVDNKCRGCRWYPLCRGGCRREREPFADGLPVLNKWCSCYAAFFEYSFSRMREMAENIAKSGKK